MKKVTVILGEEKEVEGINLNTTVKGFRQQLTEKYYTEIGCVYRAGKHVFTFITDKLNRKTLVEAGLVKPTKEEKKDLKKRKEIEENSVKRGSKNEKVR